MVAGCLSVDLQSQRTLNFNHCFNRDFRNVDKSVSQTFVISPGVIANGCRYEVSPCNLYSLSLHSKAGCCRSPNVSIIALTLQVTLGCRCQDRRLSKIQETQLSLEPTIYLQESVVHSDSEQFEPSLADWFPVKIACLCVGHFSLWGEGGGIRVPFSCRQGNQ